MYFEDSRHINHFLSSRNRNSFKYITLKSVTKEHLEALKTLKKAEKNGQRFIQGFPLQITRVLRMTFSVARVVANVFQKLLTRDDVKVCGEINQINTRE